MAWAMSWKRRCPHFYALPDEQSEVALYVHLIVREDAQLLYGFSDQGQRQFVPQFAED